MKLGKCKLREYFDEVLCRNILLMSRSAIIEMRVRILCELGAARKRTEQYWRGCDQGLTYSFSVNTCKVYPWWTSFFKSCLGLSIWTNSHIHLVLTYVSVLKCLNTISESKKFSLSAASLSAHWMRLKQILSCSKIIWLWQ